MTRKKRKRSRSDAPAGDATGWGAAWDRLSSRTQHVVCLLFLLAVAVAYYAPVLFGGLSIVGGDIVNWRAMAEVVIEHREATGDTPLWAPNAFAGMPSYMISYPNQVPQVDTVFGWLRQVAWPVSHLIVLLAGMYVLVVFITGRKLAAVLSACAFGMTTYLPVLLFAGHNSKFVALAFAPWLVVAFAYALHRPRLLSGLLFAIALAVNLRAGHVQITYYVTFMLGVWWLVELVGAVRHGRGRTIGAATLWLTAGAVLGVLMVAQPYLVNWEYKTFTIRGAATGGGEGGLAWDYAMSWSQGFGELLTLLVADAFGGGGGTYWGPKPFTAGPHYVGGVVILLALLAAWRLRRNVVWALSISVVLMVLFSLGEYLPALNRFMFAYFPLFDAFRVPETWLSAVALGLALLAGLGLYYVVRTESSRSAEAEKTRAIYVVAGGVAAFLVVLLLFEGSLMSYERPGEVARLSQQVAAQNNVAPDDPRVEQAARQYLAEVRAERADAFTGDALRTLLFVVLAGVLLVGFRREKVPAWALQAALALLVVVDLWGVDRRYLGADQFVRAEGAEAQIPTYDFDRFIANAAAEAGGEGRFRVLSLESGNPMTNARPAYHYQSLGGYHGAKLRLYQDFIDHIFVDAETGLPNENALDLLNTRYVVARQPLPGLEVAYRSERTGMLVLQNPDVLPRAFFVGRTEVVPTAEEAWERLRSEDFDPHRTALLREPLPSETTPLDSAGTASADLVRYTPDEIVWDVRTDAPRLLVVSELYYPAGWNATLDGEPVPIHRADYLLRAVFVPEGEHRLVMRFEPVTHTVGLWTTAATTMLVYGATLLLLGLAWRRRRRGDTGAKEAPAHA